MIVVVDTKPLDSTTHVRVHFTVNGGEEQSRTMEHHGIANYDTPMARGAPADGTLALNLINLNGVDDNQLRAAAAMSA
ncbi:MAG TPA: hypothetical protein DCM68_01900 [Verrucomicrobia bacterium]|nr:hypothetical protein [Verrucomicrobiota bacterium]